MTIGKLSGQCDFGQKGQSYCNQRGQSCVAKRVKVAWLFQNPTIIIYRSDKEYLLSIIYVSETTKQASPATYEIQQDGSQYFITSASKRLYVDYDPAKDVLSISSLGDYLRN